MNLRRFNAAGLVAMRNALQAMRSAPGASPPHALLEDSALTEVVTPPRPVLVAPLNTKGDAARLLQDLLQGLPVDDVARDAGLWTWLALHYFDAVCPMEAGQRTVRNDYHYVFEPENPRHYYRHLLFISWRVLIV
ncbi:MAG: hypothetical protein JSS02_33600, partial [Planctomycetes bacterium]|nr:hypothetical protein [Planctomycetota bacterium]